MDVLVIVGQFTMRGFTKNWTKIGLEITLEQLCLEEQ